jgi:glycosyltransferase involved in cell wall biosynthesis
MPEGAADRALAGVPALRVLQTGLNWFGSGSGGLDRVFADMARSLPACGIAVRGLVVAPDDVALLTSGEMQAYAPAGAGLARRMLSARRRIAELAAARAFDVIAPHFALHVATALDRLRDVPMVAHFHGPWALESRVEGAGSVVAAAKHRLERAVYRRADRVIVLSEAFARLVSETYGVDPGRVRVVPGAVCLERFAQAPDRHAARARLGWPQDRPIVLTVRRLAARMGLERLIDAMQAVVSELPDALLFIAGKGRLDAQLRARVAACGMQDSVRFLGFVPEDELALVYAAADLHVVPSVALEGFGLSAAEALAAGTPSLVTPVGGLPEVVRPLSPDLVLQSSCTADIAAGIAGALRGSPAVPSAARCRAYAQEHFQIGRAARQAAAVYREAAGAR